VFFLPVFRHPDLPGAKGSATFQGFSSQAGPIFPLTGNNSPSGTCSLPLRRKGEERKTEASLESLSSNTDGPSVKRRYNPIDPRRRPLPFFGHGKPPSKAVSVLSFHTSDGECGFLPSVESSVANDTGSGTPHTFFLVRSFPVPLKTSSEPFFLSTMPAGPLPSLSRSWVLFFPFLPSTKKGILT